MLPQLTSSLVLITPSLAKQMLENNKNFRPLSPSRVETLAAAMRRGEWEINGETIKFNCDGSLLDGQHRLAAIVRAGVPITCLVVYGVTSDLNIDCGRSRSYADILHHRGEKEPMILAGILRLTSAWDCGSLRTYNKFSTNAELDRILNKYPTARASAKRIKHARSITARSLFGFFHLAFSTKDIAAADVFIDRLDDGAGLEQGNPILHLRDRLAQNRNSKAKLTTTEILAITIIAWKFWREGRQIKTLRWVASGQNPQPFPEIE